MTRNTIIAFLLMIVVIQFFTSDFYNKKILKNNSNETVSKETIKEKVLNDSSKQVEKQEKTNSVLTIQEDTVKGEKIKIETNKITCIIDELGGRVVSLKIKDYKYSLYNPKEKAYIPGENVELINDSNIGGANLSINNQTFDNKFFKFQGTEKNIDVKEKEKRELEFIFNSGGGFIIKKTFSFQNNTYKIGYNIESNDLNGKTITTSWKSGIKESEENVSQYDPIKTHLYDGKNIENITLKASEKVDRNGFYDWIGITSKYFIIAIIPESKIDSDIKINPIKETKTENDKKIEIVNYSISMDRFISKGRDSYTILAGPTQLDELKKDKTGLQKVLFDGYKIILADKWFPPICEFVLWLLIKLQKILKDYGLVIIALTVILKIVTFPLTNSSTKAMNKMKEMQPEINKIKEKYKGNVQKMNQKVMEFYKKEGINPLAQMSGCLPMILQMPIFIALYIVLRKAIELRGAKTVIVPWIQDLSKPEMLFDLGIKIPFYGNNFALLPVLFGGLMFLQNKQTMKDPNQKMIVYMMPIIMILMFNNLPAGLSLYFMFSTGLQVLQQYLTEKFKK